MAGFSVFGRTTKLGLLFTGTESNIFLAHFLARKLGELSGGQGDWREAFQRRSPSGFGVLVMTVGSF
jgi:hypothetical protein